MAGGGCKLLTSGLAEEGVEVRQHFGGVPLLVADDFAGDFAVPVDDVGFGDHGGPVGLGDGGAVVFGGGGAGGGGAGGLGLEEFSVGGGGFGGGNAPDQGGWPGHWVLGGAQGRRSFSPGL